MKIVRLILLVIAIARLLPSVKAASPEGEHLLQTHWYQDGPFAQFTPDHDRVGCWTTAYAQILYFHRLKPSGRVQYECTSGSKVDVDLGQFSFDWEQFPNEITEQTPQTAADQVARYSFATALAVRKDFGTGGYKRLLNSVGDLEAHFPVEARIYVHLADKLPFSRSELVAKLNHEQVDNFVDRAEIVSLLSTELAAGRPMYFHFGNIVDFGHSVVIDGMCKDGARQMVHINYGFKDAGRNKWYELFAPISQPDDMTLRAFVTIKPRRLSTTGGKNRTDALGDNPGKLLNETLAPLLAQYHVPAAAVALIRGGEVIVTSVTGERESGKPATKDTLFNVASLTKPVFAHAILALVDKGAFNLDESLDHYWIDPDVLDDPRHTALTARLILSHQTGFPNWRDGKQLHFSFKPGEGVGYSGEGFEYLRRAVEAKTQKNITQIVAESVFEPFGMSDTHFVWDSTYDGRFAREHDKEGHRINVPTKSIPCAADDLLTTIGDYGRFAAAVARGAGLSARLFDETCSIQIPKLVASKASGPVDFGLCWRVVRTTHGTALMHGGSDQGVRAAVIVVPQTREGIVILTNGDNGGKIIEAVVPLFLPNGDEYLSQYIKASSPLQKRSSL